MTATTQKNTQKTQETMARNLNFGSPRGGRGGRGNQTPAVTPVTVPDTAEDFSWSPAYRFKDLSPVDRKAKMDAETTLTNQFMRYSTR